MRRQRERRQSTIIEVMQDLAVVAVFIYWAGSLLGVTWP